MSGFLNDLNEPQKQGLDGFKTKLDQELPTIRKDLEYPEEKSLVLWTVNMEQDAQNRDMVLLKFLRAREFKLDAAYAMLVACLKWRKEFGVENILNEQFPEFYNKIGEIYRADKDGRPLMFNYYCNIDVDTVFKDGTAQFLRWKVAQMERSIQLLAETGGGFKSHDRESIVVIHDYKDVSMLSMDKRTKQASKATIALLQDNYPEMLARKFFINVPWFFERLYAFFSSFANERTRKKFIICSNKTYRRELLQFIDADSLPQRYGGIASSDEVKVQTLTLKPKESHRVDLGQLPSGHLVEWEYIVETNDIAFGIIKSTAAPAASATSEPEVGSPKTNNNEQYVVPSSQHEYSAGSYRIEEPGNYIAVFDNNYSIFNKKVVHYSIKSDNKVTTTTTSTNEQPTASTENKEQTTTTTSTTTEEIEKVDETTPKASNEEQIDE